MRLIPLALVTLSCILPLASHAQGWTTPGTNAPATEIENFELQPDVIIIKGYGEVGTVATGEGVVSVRCKESDNVTAGTKQYAIAVTFTANQAETGSIVDYDELDSLIHNLDFLSKISYSVTTMPSFDAGLTTRSGFRAAAHSERRQGGIELFLQFSSVVRVTLTPDQFAQFQSLIGQAKTSLDTIKNKNSSP
jgi:hypothetical protein